MAEQQNEPKAPQVTPATPTQAPASRAPVQQRATRPHVQLRRGLQMMSFEQQSALLDPNPVQRKGGGSTDQVHEAAAQGIASGGGSLPHAQQIQAAFGNHDVSGIQAHTGSAAQQANKAMGAEAYATGNHVAFGGAPDLHTTAHEAAHVIQQQHGVSLAGGVGEVGDKYENHADKVADAVVKGESAEPILNEMTGGGAKGGTQQKSVQQMDVQRTTTTTTPPDPAAPVPYTDATAKSAIDRAAPSVSDISTPFAATLVGKDETHFNTTYCAAPGVLEHNVIKAYLATGAPKPTTQTVGSKDPIAVQKFADIDNEAHLDPAHSGLKDTFYQNLAAEMGKTSYTDRQNGTYLAMKNAGPPWVFAFKGVQIPADRISPLSARNQSVDRLFDKVLPATNAQIDSAIETPLVTAGAPPATIAAQKADQALRKKAYRHILKGVDPKTTVEPTAKISDYPTWYAPGSITVDPAAAANTEFSRLMTLGALQPEWYPNGTVVLNVAQAVGRVRECRKPTAFDGLMSALWTARNVGAADYGVTGGGLPEFLEGNLTYADVDTASAVIPSDDFLLDMQRVATQVTNEFGVDGRGNPLHTPTEERLRHSQHTSIMNTSPEVSAMYGQIIDRSTQEQNTPSGPVTAPGAATPVGTQVPARPAVAPGGAYS